jgi:TPR repeat protein
MLSMTMWCGQERNKQLTAYRRWRVAVMSAAITLALFGIGIAGALQDGQAALESGDYATALRILLPLASQGNPQAQHKLSLMYALGYGVHEDHVEAAKWERKAAEGGDPDAQFMLGSAYRSGNGVPQNAVEGLAWIRKAAEQGLAEAQYELGYAYRVGSDVPQNYAEALRWYRKAADQGHFVAQYALGGMYWFGGAVPENLVQAHMWFNIAATNTCCGNDRVLRQNAANNRDAVAREMTPAQIVEAQRLASEWKPSR